LEENPIILQSFRFGSAVADITPPVGIHMGGYWGRQSGATKVHDGLMAKVLVCAMGERKVTIVAVDLVALDADSVRAIRSRIEREAGMPGDGVMVCASHTHAGPLTLPFRGMGDVDKDYMARVEDMVVGLVVQAGSSLQVGQLRYARPTVQIGLNRRAQRRGEATGPVVPYAHVLRFEGREGTGVTLFSHACHPVVLSGANHELSGDFAGAAARYIEAQTGEMALFINGACGDINPRVTGGSFADVEALGRELGEAVVGAIADAQSASVAGLGYRRERIDLPLIEVPDRLRAEAEKLKMQLVAELARWGDIWAQRVPRARLEWAEEMLALVRRGEGGNRVQPFEIHGLALGEWVLLGMEGEIFARYQLDLEAESLMLCGFANGCIGYVPTADEYPRGGYEVDDAYKVYPSVQMIAPESEVLIRERAGELVAALRDY
jgi:hypothetical protein